VELGERFYIDVRNERLVCEVDQILTVLPDEVEYLQIVKGMDSCEWLGDLIKRSENGLSCNSWQKLVQ